MHILIDADGCPVVRIAVDFAASHKIPAIIVCDSAHRYEMDGAETIVVDKGADSADFRLVNLIRPGDVVITQDYGLAAMSLARRAKVLSQNGMLYTDDNIDSLLMARHTSRKLRNAGVRLKGPARRTPRQDADFLDALNAILRSPLH